MGPGKDTPPPVVIVLGLFKNRGGCVRDVNEDTVDGGPIAELLEVRFDQGDSLIASEASLTFL